MSEVTTTAAARPYAKAVFALAQEHQCYQRWQEALELLAEIVANQRVQRFLNAPVITHSQKAEALLAVCQDQIDKEASNLVRVMAENQRLSLLPVVAKLYRVLSDEAQGVIAVTVSSAFELEPEQSDALEKALATRFDKKVKLSCNIDPSLLGGIVIRIGDVVIDNSVKNQIVQLTDILMN